MCQHDALGKTGRARRIDQGGDTVCGVRINRLWLNIFVEWTDAQRAQTSRLCDNRAMPLGMLSGMMGHAGGVDQTAGAAMIPDLINLSR